MSPQVDFMLSRLAEHLYWMGRYVERAENSARLVSVHDQLLLDPGSRPPADWKHLVEITGSKQLFTERAGKKASAEREVLRFLLVDPANPGSMLSSIEAARENARVLRALLPREAWECLNELALETRSAKTKALERKSRDAFLTRTVRQCQTQVGLLAGTMNHDAGYRFVKLGRLLERADMTTRIIDVYSRTVLAGEEDVDRAENNHWVPVLRSLAAYQMYRQRRQVRVRRLDALDFLLRDRVFPRASLFCLESVEEGISQLPNPTAPLAAVRRAAQVLRSARVERFSDDPEKMSAFVDRAQIEIAKVHSSIASTWFPGG